MPGHALCSKHIHASLQASTPRKSSKSSKPNAVSKVNKLVNVSKLSKLGKVDESKLYEYSDFVQDLRRTLAKMRCTHVVAQSNQVQDRSETSSTCFSPVALHRMRNSFCYDIHIWSHCVCRMCSIEYMHTLHIVHITYTYMCCQEGV